MQKLAWLAAARMDNEMFAPAGQVTYISVIQQMCFAVRSPAKRMLHFQGNPPCQKLGLKVEFSRLEGLPISRACSDGKVHKHWIVASGRNRVSVESGNAMKP